MSDRLPLGRFHEISLSTGDLAASIGFWHEQGWTQAKVRPVWPQPYAALSYGALVIGLHEYRFPSPSVTCVHPDIATALEEHRDAGMVIAFAKTGPGVFNEFGFRDPADQMITLLEAVTHDALPTSDRAFFSLPSPDPELSLRFWGLLGAVPDGVAPEDWPCTRRTAGGLPLAIHPQDDHDGPTIVRTLSGGDVRVQARTVLESPEGVAWVTVGG